MAHRLSRTDCSGPGLTRKGAGRGFAYYDDEGVRESYLLARDNAPASGWHAVGYEARGPRGGPLVIGVVRQREDGDAFDDAKELVERNAGG